MSNSWNTILCDNGVAPRALTHKSACALKGLKIEEQEFGPFYKINPVEKTIMPKRRISGFRITGSRL